MRPLLGLATTQTDGNGSHEGGEGTEHKDERDPTEEPGPEGADRRTEEQAAHLESAVQAERLAATFGRCRISQIATGGWVVGSRRESGTGAQHHEREWPGKDQRQQAEDPGRDEPDDHQWHPGSAIRKPAE